MAIDRAVRKAQNALKPSKIHPWLPPVPRVADLQNEDDVDRNSRTRSASWFSIDVEKTRGQEITNLKEAIRQHARAQILPTLDDRFPTPFPPPKSIHCLPPNSPYFP